MVWDRILQGAATKNIGGGVKRQNPAPIYQEGPNRFGIDSCLPQIRAVNEGKIELRALTKGHYPGTVMGKNELPGLSSIGFWNSRGPQDWGLEAHRNEGVEITFLESGSMDFTVDGGLHALQSGHLTLTRPWQLHKLGNPHVGRGRLYWLILDVGVRRPNQPWEWPSWLVLSPPDLAELTRKLRGGEKAVWMANPRIREIFHELADCVNRWGEPRISSRLAVTLNRLFVEVLGILVEQQADESPELATRRRTVELFLKDLAGNPTTGAEPWTIESMARHCGMGVTSMAKYCGQLVNAGPMAYLNLCRLGHSAKALKTRSDLSVTEIAMMSGFNSSQYFSTLFRSYYKMTPTRFRAEGDGNSRSIQQGAGTGFPPTGVTRSKA